MSIKLLLQALIKFVLGLLLFFAMPLVLQSWISLLCMLPLPIILAKRIRNEEEVLKNGLAGYEDYMRRVKFRLIPFVW